MLVINFILLTRNIASRLSQRSGLRPLKGLVYRLGELETTCTVASPPYGTAGGGQACVGSELHLMGTVGTAMFPGIIHYIQLLSPGCPVMAIIYCREKFRNAIKLSITLGMYNNHTVNSLVMIAYILP